MTRTRGQNEKTEITRKYKEEKKLLTIMIRRAKRQAWRDLCTKLEDDIWGDGYRFVVKAVEDITLYDVTNKRKEQIVRELFICEKKIMPKNRERDINVEKYTADLIKEAGARMKIGKAPGMGGIPPEAIKEIFKFVEKE